MHMSFFKHHVFFCTNQRTQGDACCGNHGAGEMRDYAKDRVKAVLPKKGGNVRVSNAGCLGRCDVGPVMVVYPEAVWYTYKNKEDIDEIVESHLKQGRVVDRLKV